jgi:hypothetical protein
MAQISGATSTNMKSISKPVHHHSLASTHPLTAHSAEGQRARAQAPHMTRPQQRPRTNAHQPSQPASTDSQPNQPAQPTDASVSPPLQAHTTCNPRTPTQCHAIQSKNPASARGVRAPHNSPSAREGVWPCLQGGWPYLEPSYRRRKRQPRTRGPAAMRPMNINPEPPAHPVPVRRLGMGCSGSTARCREPREGRGVYARGTHPPSNP